MAEGGGRAADRPGRADSRRSDHKQCARRSHAVGRPQGARDCDGGLLGWRRRRGGGAWRAEQSCCSRDGVSTSSRGTASTPRGPRQRGLPSCCPTLWFFPEERLLRAHLKQGGERRDALIYGLLPGELRCGAMTARG